MASGAGSPCGACKFLRRKCAAECVFAPYFCSEQGAARFAAIHKVFGASNVSKLLLHVPAADRCEAVVTIAYEAQARIRDPVYGCVAHIFALQQQVAYLQAQLMQAKSQLSQNLVDHQSSSSSSSRNTELHEWNTSHGIGIGIGSSSSGAYAFPVPNYGNYYSSNISPQSSLDSMEHQNDGMMQEIEENSRVNYNGTFQGVNYSKKRPSQTDLGELQALAFRMMKNEN